jgi:protein ImuA
MSDRLPATAAADRPPIDQAALLAALRARVARHEGAGRARHGAAPIPLFPGASPEGLARAALHEILAVDPGAAAAFAAVLLARSGGTVLWIGAGRDSLTAWPPGLARCGLSPADLILLRAERWTDALWAMEEALRCPAVAGTLLAPDWDADATACPLDLTAGRRLQLAAEAGGGIGLLLRPDTPRPPPSAATTRWRINAQNAAATGHGLGDPRWQLDLLRNRGGKADRGWTVTWRAAAGEMDGGGA